MQTAYDYVNWLLKMTADGSHHHLEEETARHGHEVEESGENNEKWYEILERIRQLKIDDPNVNRLFEKNLQSTTADSDSRARMEKIKTIAAAVKAHEAGQTYQDLAQRLNQISAENGRMVGQIQALETELKETDETIAKVQNAVVKKNQTLKKTMESLPKVHSE